jgi:alpha-beta hydrolase superfamily lysophospholipase
VRDCS